MSENVGDAIGVMAGVGEWLGAKIIGDGVTLGVGENDGLGLCAGVAVALAVGITRGKGDWVTICEGALEGLALRVGGSGVDGELLVFCVDEAIGVGEGDAVGAGVTPWVRSTEAIRR